mmetsp:Transcript_12960/g.30569  ORF Transcript_12960/g.30569 Transcript_12960/m.30569 type:complete len:215 (-) Transcript_12960:609-1253(-)
MLSSVARSCCVRSWSCESLALSSSMWALRAGPMTLFLATRCCARTASLAILRWSSRSFSASFFKACCAAAAGLSASAFCCARAWLLDLARKRACVRRPAAAWSSSCARVTSLCASMSSSWASSFALDSACRALSADSRSFSPRRLSRSATFSSTSLSCEMPLPWAARASSTAAMAPLWYQDSDPAFLIFSLVCAARLAVCAARLAACLGLACST